MSVAGKPVAIIMGSQSDWATMRHAAEALNALEIAYDALHRLGSPHAGPALPVRKGREENGFKVIIAGAGGAAHLPGMAAAMTRLPVLGVPVESKALSGQDSLLSIVQMPAGIPVGTLAIGRAGAVNAALLAAAILALSDAGIAERLDAYRAGRRRLSPNARRTTRDMLKPGDTIGILGGGQLARMLALAAAPLGLDATSSRPNRTVRPFEWRPTHVIAS